MRIHAPEVIRHRRWQPPAGTAPGAPAPPPSPWPPLGAPETADHRHPHQLPGPHRPRQRLHRPPPGTPPPRLQVPLGQLEQRAGIGFPMRPPAGGPERPPGLPVKPGPRVGPLALPRVHRLLSSPPPITGRRRRPLLARLLTPRCSRSPFAERASRSGSTPRFVRRAALRASGRVTLDRPGTAAPRQLDLRGARSDSLTVPRPPSACLPNSHAAATMPPLAALRSDRRLPATPYRRPRFSAVIRHELNPGVAPPQRPSLTCPHCRVSALVEGGREPRSEEVSGRERSKLRHACRHVNRLPPGRSCTTLPQEGPCSLRSDSPVVSRPRGFPERCPAARRDARGHPRCATLTSSHPETPGTPRRANVNFDPVNVIKGGHDDIRLSRAVSRLPQCRLSCRAGVGSGRRAAKRHRSRGRAREQGRVAQVHEPLPVPGELPEEPAGRSPSRCHSLRGG